jgi:hypothetical protein
VDFFPGFQDDCWFSTGHFAVVMMGFGHDAEASSCFAFYGAQCSFVYVTGSRLLIPSVMKKLLSSANYNGNIVLKNVRCYVFLLLTGNQWR